MAGSQKGRGGSRAQPLMRLLTGLEKQAIADAMRARGYDRGASKDAFSYYVIPSCGEPIYVELRHVSLLGRRETVAVIRDLRRDLPAYAAILDRKRARKDADRERRNAYLREYNRTHVRKH